MGVHHNEDGSSYKKYSNPVKVPFLNGQPIYQYQALEYHGAPYGDYYRFNNFLSEKVGNTFSEWMDTRYGDFTEHKEVVQKTIDKNHDSILIVKGHWVYGPLLGDTSILIYTKNIGLTSSIILNENRDTISKTILIEYFINKQ
jgi:hypothetical protein